MSLFDPYKLYHPNKHYTRNGQVIQKKLVDRDYAITGDDIKKAIKVLTSVGYYVNKSLPTFKNYFKNYSGYYRLSGEPLPATINLSPNDLYQNTITAEDPMYEIPTESIIDGGVQLKITSIMIKSNGLNEAGSVNIDVGDTIFTNYTHQGNSYCYCTIIPYTDEYYVKMISYDSGSTFSYNQFNTPTDDLFNYADGDIVNIINNQGITTANFIAIYEYNQSVYLQEVVINYEINVVINYQ